MSKRIPKFVSENLEIVFNHSVKVKSLSLLVKSYVISKNFRTGFRNKKKLLPTILIDWEVSKCDRKIWNFLSLCSQSMDK